MYFKQRNHLFPNPITEPAVLYRMKGWRVRCPELCVLTHVI